jgi:phytoene dehydrogenase-like protein
VTTSGRPLDAVVVGSGPNGLAAALTLAREGLAVRVLEAADTAGGGTRSAALTLPGYVHDVCSTVVATALASPFFADLDLARLGVGLAHPEAPVAHALTPDRAVVLERSLEATAAGLGRDGAAYRRLLGPLVTDAERLLPWVMGPVLGVPRHPVMEARFGLRGLLPARALGRLGFREDPARALLAGLSAHSMLPLEALASASFGLVMALSAHVVGWPVVRGGTQALADALVAELRRLGGEVVTGQRVTSLGELPPARAILLDLTPRQVAAVGGDRLPPGYRRALERFRYGPGVCKVDWALDGPIPWLAPDLARAGTVHLGGTLDDVARAERAVHRGRLAAEPFVLLVQSSVFDPSRSPAGRHTAWAYCHVPGGSSADATAAIEARVERFAPGFRDRILGRATHTAPEMEAYDANYVGGDINGGLQDLRQLLARPVLARDPYATPVPGLYLCSSSTPPGGGVHGMSGHLAARSALRREFGVRAAPLSPPGAPPRT